MKTFFITTSLAAMFLASTVIASKNTSDDKSPTPTDNSKRAAVAALIKNMEYDNDRSAVRNKYYSDLDKLAEAVKEENYTLSLRGHADSVGQYKYNWMLSDKRALLVKNYLISKGVKKDKIVTTPFGSTVPVASNKTEEGRQKNRRVEISMK
jgi:outer membrane protein OmpA-like peptidoglycan-associated protein